MQFLIAFLITLLLTACNNNDHIKYSASTKNMELSQNELSQEHPGKKLMENNCYACHSPKASEENMIAPPMVAVKVHYISDETTKEEFVNEMLAWVKRPS